jgi:chondroitin AC lyase
MKYFKFGPILFFIQASAFLLLMFTPPATATEISTGPAGNEIDQVKNRCRLRLLSDTAYATEQSYRFTDDVKYDTDAAGYLHSLTPAGYWGDIDYRSPMRSSWKPSWHLYRTMLLCRAYFKNKDPQYLNAVHLALAFWTAHDFQCSNWWQNQINVPFAYSSLMIMLNDQATRDELAYMDDKLISRMVVYKATGQNLIWQYDNQARIALLHHDQRSFDKLMKGMQDVIQISTEEGIQPDYSFQQHGVMLQFGNYGLHFINSLLFWMNVTSGSKFAFAPDKQQILFNYCTEGLRWTIYKGGMDITAVGRQIRNGYTTKRGEDLQDDFNLIRQIVPDQYRCLYTLDGLMNPAQINCSIEGNKGFWRSAYMIQQAAGHYMFSVRTHGGTVKKVEAINGENLKGSFLNDGVTLVQRTGQEYRNIEAFWNWSMLPGTTCDTTMDPANRIVFNTSNDQSNFVGQLSTGKEGISTMYYNRLGVSAYKSYFLIDGMMVCLGADIHSVDSANVVTTLDQRFYRGKSSVITGQSTDNKQWLWQDSTAYFSLDNQQSIKTKLERRTGNWNTIDLASDNTITIDSVITIYTGHENKDQYAYWIMPATGLKEAKQMAANPAINLVLNNHDIQAIKTKDCYMVVFYKPDVVSYLDGVKLKADKPCILLYKKNGAQTTVWLSDPTRKLAQVKLKINELDEVVKLPSGNLAGSTVMMSF